MECLASSATLRSVEVAAETRIATGGRGIARQLAHRRRGFRRVSMSHVVGQFRDHVCSLQGGQLGHEQKDDRNNERERQIERNMTTLRRRKHSRTPAANSA